MRKLEIGGQQSTRLVTGVGARQKGREREERGARDGEILTGVHGLNGRVIWRGRKWRRE